MKTPRTRIRRLPKRGVYDREAVYAMLDEALVCHVAFVVDGEPHLIPTAIARLGDHVYIHGNRASRMLRHLAAGASACIAVTHLDGLVLARSGFHSSMNYRSVVIYARGEPVSGPGKHSILDALVDKLVPGRAADTRPMTRKELAATTVIRFPLEEVSAKARSGPPADDAEDYGLPIWAGELPLGLEAGEPVADPNRRLDVPAPAYLRRPRSAAAQRTAATEPPRTMPGRGR